MRIIIKIKAKKDFSYGSSSTITVFKQHEKDYYRATQSVIYWILKDKELHDAQERKHFSFSELIPKKDGKVGDIYTLIIASAKSNLLRKIFDNFPTTFRLGNAEFSTVDMKAVSDFVGDSITIRSATPIHIGLPHNKWWTKEQGLDLAIKTLEENVVKGFNHCFGENIESFNFQEFQLKKTVNIPIKYRTGNSSLTCSLWEFTFNNLTAQEKRIVRYILGAGLGNKTSLGFGFMNKVRT